MTHLAEVHITEGLEQHADDIEMRAYILQSHLESAAASLNNVKSMPRFKTISNSEDAEDDDNEVQNLLLKTDDIISQIRSAKVVSSKAIRHLEELKSRSLTLDQTTLPAIEKTQLSTSEIALSARTIGLSVTQLLNEEGRTAPFTYSELYAAMSLDNLPFSGLASKMTNTMAQLQAFYNMTSNLAQTVEIPSPPPPPPWQLLAQKLRDEAAVYITQEAEFVQAKNEIQERNAALAMRDKILEEMTVKVEVLEKRVGESGGRKEQAKQLETALQAAKVTERELISKLGELRRDLRSLEAEREQWKKTSMAPVATAADLSRESTVSTAPSVSALAQIQLLKTQISTLESTIRYLRNQAHTLHFQSTLAFLNEPLIPPQPPAQSLLQTEARDALKEMLHLVTQPKNQLVKFVVPERGERLKWRPAKDTAAWRTSRMKEEWEGWREWKHDLSKRSTHGIRPDQERKAVNGPKKTLARLNARLPHVGSTVKGAMKEVKILDPGEWEDVLAIAGVEAT